MLKEKVLEFILYLGHFLKKFLIWLLASGGILGLLYLFRVIKTGLPSPVLWLVGCIGLLWAGFKIYKEQQKEVPPEKDIIKLKRRSKISLSLREGNKFDYIINDTGISLILRELPTGTIVLHTEIFNTGPSDVDILSVRGGFNPHELWFADFQSAAVDSSRNEINYPRHLPVGGKQLIDLLFPVKPNPSLNQAQIKDRLFRHQKKATRLEYKLCLEFHDPAENTRRIFLKEKISSERLAELYLEKLLELEEMVAGFHKKA